MTDRNRGRTVAWIVLALLSVAYYGNYYVYDSVRNRPPLASTSANFTASVTRRTVAWSVSAMRGSMLRMATVTIGEANFNVAASKR